MTSTILEKAIAHVIHGDTGKAEALFHKFMVETARKIHESLRQDDDVDLKDGWDNEIKEEEYFDGDDLASAEDDENDKPVDDGKNGDDGEFGADTEMSGDQEDEDMDMDPDMDMDMDKDVEDGLGDADGLEDMDGGGIAGKIDALGDKIDDFDSKIDELTKEFDRMMSELDGDSGDEFGDDIDDEEPEDMEDMGGSEEPEMDSEDANDLAGRMKDDMAGDDEEPEPEEVPMEGMEMDDEESLDEELADITESVLSELDKVAMPGNTEGKGVGAGGYNVTGDTNKEGMLPKHKVNDRVGGAKPYMVKGGNNDRFERETAPSVKPVSGLVKKPTNSRSKWQDGTKPVPRDGDGSALLNKNFAGGEKTGKSPVDGEMKPRTR